MAFAHTCSCSLYDTSARFIEYWESSQRSVRRMSLVWARQSTGVLIAVLGTRSGRKHLELTVLGERGNSAEFPSSREFVRQSCGLQGLVVLIRRVSLQLTGHLATALNLVSAERIKSSAGDECLAKRSTRAWYQLSRA
eukprot:3144380-Amphidinium_carterae.2